jgi:4-hydroxy-tetrahydrodipicolinate synthase
VIDLAADFLKGSYPPIVTPFKNGEVDFDTYGELVEHQIREGSHGILANGTTAEPSSLTAEERNQIVSIAVDSAAKRVPVVAATGSQSLAETRELTDYAERAGADALLVVTPYYIRPPQRGLVAYYQDIAERSSLPLMIYHIPGRTAVSVSLETLMEISESAANFVGMKHAVADLNFVTDVLNALGDDFRIFVGLEDLSFPMLAVGACGMMNAVGNLAPRKVAALYEAVAAGKLDEGRALHRDLWELNKAVFFDTNPIAMKYMLRRMGLLPANEHRLPMVPATPELEARLDGVLERAGLI